MDHNAVVATLLAAQEPSATVEQRRLANDLFIELKKSDASAAASLAVDLMQPTRPLEIQVLGYTLLQHLVGNRWQAFSDVDRTNMATLAYQLLQQASSGTTAYVIRSKTALLLALIIQRSGAKFMKTSLVQLVEQAAASGSPISQEVTCLVLKHVADEVVHMPADDLHGDALRLLVTTLTEVLPTILQFLQRTIETNFQATTAGGGGGGSGNAAAHVSAIHAALEVAEAQAEWAPMVMIKDSGLITAAGFLLSHVDYRESACRVLTQVAARKATGEEVDNVPFAAAMQEAGDALLRTAKELLTASNELDFEGDNEEFGQAVCDAMAILGCGHFRHSMPDQACRVAFLECMLSFAQHPFLHLADKALALWAKLLQDAASSVHAAHKAAAATAATAASSQGASQGGAASNAAHEVSLPPEAVVVLMQLAAEQLQQRNPHVPQVDDNVPPYFDSFEDYKEFMIGYRFKLSTIVKSAAAVLPQKALEAASERLATAIAAAASTNDNAAALAQARVLLESAVVFVDSTCRAVWDAASAAGDSVVDPVIAATEPMLQSLLTLRTTDTHLLLSQAKGLEAFGRLVGARPDLAAPVISCLFELLVGVVPLEQGGHIAPPSRPPPGWREGLVARSTVASVFLAHARVAPHAFLPHLEGIAKRLTELSDANQLRPGERNSVCEGLLAASLAGSESLQASLAEWALAPVRATWSSPEWQASVASPSAFMAHYIPTPAQPTAERSVVDILGGAERWALYHQVHMVERAVRRLLGGGTPPPAGAPPGTQGSHPLTAHMAWAMPALLQVTACFNAVYSPAGREALGPAGLALELSPQECAIYLKNGPAGRRSQRPSAAITAVTVPGAAAAAAAAAVATDSDSGDYLTVAGSSISSLRAWLRHLREFCFQTLGLLPVNVPPALDIPGLAAAVAPAACAYLDTLDHRHVRIVLRHMIIPHIKNMPARHLEGWVVPCIAAIAPHMHDRLAAAWQGIGNIDDHHLGGAGGVAGHQDAIATNREILREREVRELTQEYADVLREISTRHLEDPVAGPGPTGAPLGAASIPFKPGKSISSSPTLLQLVFQYDYSKGIAVARAAVEGMQRPDDAAHRFAMFCRALVALAPLNQEIYKYVGFQVLQAAIMSLASEVMSKHQADILGLIRSIIHQQLSDPNSNVHGVLRSLPGATAELEAAFRQEFMSTGSEKEQRNTVKKFLVEACGAQSFAALLEWKPPAAAGTAAAVVGGMRQRGARAAAAAAAAAGRDVVAEETLQGEITRHLFSSS